MDGGRQDKSGKLSWLTGPPVEVRGGLHWELIFLSVLMVRCN